MCTYTCQGPCITWLITNSLLIWRQLCQCQTARQIGWCDTERQRNLHLRHGKQTNNLFSDNHQLRLILRVTMKALLKLCTQIRQVTIISYAWLILRIAKKALRKLCTQIKKKKSFPCCHLATTVFSVQWKNWTTFLNCKVI